MSDVTSLDSSAEAEDLSSTADVFSEDAAVTRDLAAPQHTALSSLTVDGSHAADVDSLDLETYSELAEEETAVEVAVEEEDAV